MDNQELNLNTEVETEIAVAPTPALTAEEEHQAMLNDFTQFIRDTHPKLKDVADEAFIVTIYPHHTLAVATVDIKVRAEGIEENFAFTIPNEDMAEVRFAMATQAYGILKQISSEHPGKIGNYRLKFNPQTIYFDREKAGEGFEEFAEMYTGDFEKIEKKVDRVGKAVVDMIRNRAGYALKNFVASLPEKQEYDLIFTWNFDEKNHLNFCLDKIAPVHDNPDTASVNRTPVNLDEWLDEDGNHNKSLVYLCNQMKNINTMIDQSLNFNSGSKVRDEFTKQLFDKVIFHPLYNDNKTILVYNDPEGKDIVEQTDAILQKLQELAGPDGDVRLDMDSLQVYRWDAEGNSSLVLPVDVIQQFFAKYIQSFGNTLYHHLKTVSSPLIRPHVVRTQIEPKAEGEEVSENKGAAVADLLAQSGLTKKVSNGQPQIDQTKMYMRQAIQMGIYEQSNEAAAKLASEEYRRVNPIKVVTTDPYLYDEKNITAEQKGDVVGKFDAGVSPEQLADKHLSGNTVTHQTVDTDAPSAETMARLAEVHDPLLANDKGGDEAADENFALPGDTAERKAGIPTPPTEEERQKTIDRLSSLSGDYGQDPTPKE